MSLTASYYTQSYRQAEKLKQEICSYLMSYCSWKQNQWCEFLPRVEYAQNSLTHLSTGLNSFQCILGYQPPMLPWSGTTSDVPAVDDWINQSQATWDSAHMWPPPHFRVSQIIWLSMQNLKFILPCHKLSPRFIGPFKINQVTYWLQLPPSYSISPMFHMSLHKPVHTLPTIILPAQSLCLH